MSEPKESPWMNEARQLAAQCWCDKETENREMDVVLCEAVAHRIASWMDSAAEFARSSEYYRDLLVRCGGIIGKEAYTADDGNITDQVLCAKIPELVLQFCGRR